MKWLLVVATIAAVATLWSAEAIHTHDNLEKHHPRSRPRRKPTGRDLKAAAREARHVFHAQSTNKPSEQHEYKTNKLKPAKQKPIHHHASKFGMFLEVMVQLERNMTNRMPTAMKPGFECQWKQKGIWNIQKPLKFVYDERGSGLNHDAFYRALVESWDVWKQANPNIPDAAFVKTHYEDPTDFLPSSHRERRVPNYLNEISFEPRHTVSLTTEFHQPISEVYLWYSNDGGNKSTPKLIQEADIILASDPDAGWCVHDAQTGDPDRWSVPMTGKFDIHGVLIKSFGHVMGLDHIDAFDHSMHGLSRRDECCKRSLECGDVAGIKALYPNPSPPPLPLSIGDPTPGVLYKPASDPVSLTPIPQERSARSTPAPPPEDDPRVTNLRAPSASQLNDWQMQ